ncbi:MAG: FAD-dependent oxidoreductase [Propionibacteriales bacterium]|nr:FAD-dependent oxidoreductase [Propionibacteriales bacterium]
MSSDSWEAEMDTEYVETVIIGAGQAGLSTGYHLRRRGRPFVILDANDRIGDNWREQWDSLRLYTPVRYDGLPGMRFPGRRWEFPGKEDVADYLESYAAHFELPVRTHTRAQRVAPDGAGYLVTTADRQIRCDNVVVATGTFGRTPDIPEFAVDLDPAIHQLHSSQYRRPAQLPDGPVLVVGASHSGTDVAYELAETRPTTLCGRDCGQFPLRLESRRTRLAAPVLVFVARHVLSRRTPIGRKMMGEVRAHGGPMLRVQREDLEARGVRRTESRVVGVRDGHPLLDDGRVMRVASVVWCTGFRQVFDWIDVPGIEDAGWPPEHRGVVDLAPGLFFCGLSFQSAFSSNLLLGAGRDAEYVVRRITGRRVETATTATAAERV